jgi:imidazolonepropionase-like amidohydrolase
VLVQGVRAARLFDGDRMVAPANVLIEGGTIIDVGVSVPDSISTVDLGDATLLPGLIDCHQHLCFDRVGTLEQQVSGINDDRLLARARENAQRALRGGITTLRDLGDRGFVTLALRDDPTLPTILTAGPPVTSPSGHCWYLGGECAGTVELRRAVAARAEAGCDVVKVMVSGGYHTPTVPMWDSQFDPDDLRLVVGDAHRRGLPVAAHCHGNDAIAQALSAGADSIEHCTFFVEGFRSDPPDELIERLAKSGVVISATLGRLPDVPVPPLVTANAPILNEARRRLHELGATIVVGTDAGISEPKPHDVMPHAMSDLVAGGMTPLEALRALTSVAARALSVDGHKGRLASGFDADLIAVDGDPLADPLALTSIIAVWRAGQRVV